MTSALICSCSHSSTFFFSDSATTEIYTLSLHDALPIYEVVAAHDVVLAVDVHQPFAFEHVIDLLLHLVAVRLDRKSTRLNSSHSSISYAVFCLKKKKMLIALMTLPVVASLFSREQMSRI